MHSSKNLTLPQSSPTLSVIVPMLNEAAILPQLFATLRQQEEIDFELLLVDGGSADNSIEIAHILADSSPFFCRILSSPPGRGVQMNTGATAARGTFFLFLHADSTFIEIDALSRAMTTLHLAIAQRGDDSVAGRFTLRFEGNQFSKNFAFHEAKARCNRPGCIHGDQGFLLSRHFFARNGTFETTLSFLEDDRFADRVFALGEWRLLPVQIITSTRRFNREGFHARRTLNALILTLAAIGRNDILSVLPEIYKEQGQSDRIDLLSFFLRINDIIKTLPSAERRLLWHDAGRYVWSNRWQLMLLLRIRLGIAQAAVRTSACEEKKSACTLDGLQMMNFVGGWCSALVVRVWFWTKTSTSAKKTGRLNLDQVKGRGVNL